MPSPLQQADNPCSLSGGTKEEVLARFKNYLIESAGRNTPLETRQQRDMRHQIEQQNAHLTVVNEQISMRPNPEPPSHIKWPPEYVNPWAFGLRDNWRGD